MRGAKAGGTKADGAAGGTVKARNKPKLKAVTERGGGAAAAGGGVASQTKERARVVRGGVSVGGPSPAAKRKTPRQMRQTSAKRGGRSGGGHWGVS